MNFFNQPHQTYSPWINGTTMKSTHSINSVTYCHVIAGRIDAWRVLAPLAQWHCTVACCRCHTHETSSVHACTHTEWGLDICVRDTCIEWRRVNVIFFVWHLFGHSMSFWEYIYTILSVAVYVTHISDHISTSHLTIIDTGLPNALANGLQWTYMWHVKHCW